MRQENVDKLPIEAFARGIKKLRERMPNQNVAILGFDTEYDSATQEIVCYQLSDGYCSICLSVSCQHPKDEEHRKAVSHVALLEREKDLTWQELAQWVVSCLTEWGYRARDLNTILLVSHFSTAELSHVENFWEDAEVRRVSAGQVYNANYRINKHTNLVVMDNYHFWNVGSNGNASLMAVAEKFGEQKLEYDTTKVSRESLKDPLFREYAVWDAVLCARVFRMFRQRLLADHQIDVIQYPTSASLAMAVYRQHFMPNDLEAPEPRVRRQAWLSLWGGRAEAYQQGDFSGEWTLRDVSSLYPTSERLLGILPRKEDWIERLEPETWQGLCRVKFSFPPHIKYPCLPVCHEAKLIFPLQGISDCTLDEAKVAFQMGATLEFLRVWEYDTGDNSLTQFMEHFIQQKSTHEEVGRMKDGKWEKCEAKKCDHSPTCEMRDAVGRELSKLMMNSLIGKLSQNKGDVDIEAMKKFSREQAIPLPVVLSPQFFHPDKPKAMPRIGGHIMPEWSALILGKARSIMAVLLNEVGSSLICSTDSLLIPSILNSKVDQVMNTLGVKLTDKNGGKITHKVRIVRNRVYAAVTEKNEMIFGASHAIHLGGRKNGCEECEKKTCKDPLHNSLRFILSNETEYTKTRRAGLKTAIRKGKKFFSEEKDVPMEFDRAWDKKRRLLANGTTQPWESIEEYDRTYGRRSITLISPNEHS